MIDIYLYADLSDAVKKKCLKSHGGRKTIFGTIKLNDEAKEEHRRVMLLPISQIYEFLKQ